MRNKLGEYLRREERKRGRRKESEIEDEDIQITQRVRAHLLDGK